MWLHTYGCTFYLRRYIQSERHFKDFRKKETEQPRSALRNDPDPDPDP